MLVGEAFTSVLFHEELIRQRVRELAGEIECNLSLPGLVVMPVMSGAALFGADLFRALHGMVTWQPIVASSYFGGLKSTEHIAVAYPTPNEWNNIHGRRVLLVDTVLDSGRTLHELTRRAHLYGAQSVHTCVLVQKDMGGSTKADFVGWKCPPDRFLIGYGLDYMGFFRNVPFIGELALSLRNVDTLPPMKW